MSVRVDRIQRRSKKFRSDNKVRRSYGGKGRKARREKK